MLKKSKIADLYLIVLSTVTFAVAPHLAVFGQTTPSPYNDQIPSPVRGLSAEEVDNLLNGRGAGYARMAELNSYPGPAHVLELQDQLELSHEQIQDIETIFQRMNTKAKEIGQAIVAREQELSGAFASQTITSTELQTHIQTLADLYGELRLTHLEAHLEITPMLSSTQIVLYNSLRGYTSDGDQDDHHHRHE